MDPELQLLLQDCLRSVGELLDLLEQDDADIPGCVGGEILEAYQRGVYEAAQMAGEVRQTLSLLRDGM